MCSWSQQLSLAKRLDQQLPIVYAHSQDLGFWLNKQDITLMNFRVAGWQILLPVELFLPVSSL